VRPFRLAIFALALSACQAAWDGAFDAYRRGDHAIAVPALRLLAANGSAEAQYMLGHAHEWGQGAEQDYALAEAWYRRSAEAGDPLAPYALAEMAEAGKGGAPDLARAWAWYGLAAERAPAEEKAAILARRAALEARLPPDALRLSPR
jgi:TPR repeat protein